VEVCQKGKWGALRVVFKADEDISGRSRAYKLYALTPEEITRDLVVNLYGEAGEELI
jgi:hypothetical protein